MEREINNLKEIKAQNRCTSAKHRAFSGGSRKKDDEGRGGGAGEWGGKEKRVSIGDSLSGGEDRVPQRNYRHTKKKKRPVFPEKKPNRGRCRTKGGRDHLLRGKPRGGKKPQKIGRLALANGDRTSWVKGPLGGGGGGHRNVRRAEMGGEKNSKHLSWA